MICLKKCFLTSLLSLFEIQASTTEDQLIGTKGETFLRKLRYNIRKHEDHEEKEKTQDYAFFRIAGEYMQIEDFYKLYQSLFATSSPEKMVSMITIRNVHSNKSHSANDYLKTIIKGVQHCVQHADSTVIFYGLALTIDYFDLKNLDEYNKRYKYIEQVNSIHKKCEILMVENCYKICFDALNYKIISAIKGKIYFQIILDNPLINELLSDTHVENTKQQFWQILKLIIAEFDPLEDVFRIYGFFFQAKNRTEKTFKKIYSEICCYEEKIQCSYFTDNTDQFWKFMSYAVQFEHEKCFSERVIDLASQCVNVFAAVRAKEVTLRFFADIFPAFINVWKTISTRGYVEFGQVFDCFCEEEYFQAKLQEFFIDLHINEIEDQHNAKYRVENDIIRREIEQEQITTIFYNRQICSKSIYQLCSILCERKLLTNYSHQFLYIDNGRSVSEVEATRCTEICDTIKLESGDKEKMVEFVSTIVPKSKGGGSTALQYFTYRRDVTLKREMSNVSYTERSKLSSKTVITIDEYDKAGFVAASLEHAKTLTEKCLAACDKYILLNTHVVHVANNHESYIIHVIQLKQKGKLGKKLLLIYDVPLASGTKEQCEYRHSDRRFTCHNHAPKHFVENLLQSLQLLQLTPLAEFRVPNKCSLDNFGPMLNHDIDGIESIHDSYDQADKEACTYFDYKSYSRPLKRIHIQVIYNYDIDKISIYEYESCILKSFGLDRKIFWEILMKLLMNVQAADEAFTGGNKRGKMIEIYEYRLIATSPIEKSLNLRLCRTARNFYINSVPFTFQKILAIISKTKGVLCTLQNLDHIASKSNRMNSFSAILSSNLCRRINYEIQSFYSYVGLLTREDCLHILYESIETLFKRLQKECSSEVPIKTGKWNLSNVQRSINANEIVMYAKILAKEMRNLTLQKEMKVTSIKLKKTGDECYELFERFDDVLCYDSEHVYFNDL